MSDNRYYADAIETVFAQFDINAAVTGSTRGPSVTRYKVALGNGVKVEKIASLRKNIAYATAADSVRILAPIPGETAVGIELPNDERDTVDLADTLAGPDDRHPLTVGLGQTVDGKMLSINLAEMPHLLVAGATGSGKSTFVNAALVSILQRATPAEVRLLLIDPKMVELTPYDGIAHLLRPVVTDAEEAITALTDLVAEMERRYKLMRQHRARTIDGLGLPYIVAVVDELADLMMASKKLEPLIVRLAQKARAAGIHLLLATQRPSVDVVTGLLKANVPSRLAFATSSLVDSRVVLDEGGAEQLLGMGDGLYKPVGARAAIRIQGAYVSDKEIEAAVVDATPTPKRAPQQSPFQHLDELIGYTDDAIQRIDRYLKKLNSNSMKESEKMLAFLDTPIELGKAASAMDEIARRLRKMQAI